VAVLDDLILIVARRETVSVLHGGDWHDAPGCLDLFDRHIREADVPDLACIAQFCKRADRLLQRDRRVHRVKLVEIDPVESEAAKARFANRAQALRSAVGTQLPGPFAN